MKLALETQAITACRHLLSEINRDPSSGTFGCFDRRYWAWKLTDFPEATFQRNIFAFSWLLNKKNSFLPKRITEEVIKSGLCFTFKNQHRDGSFDQAYPNEHSYGATGFLLSDLINVYQEIKPLCTDLEIRLYEEGLYKSAKFLVKNSEQHNLISNHLAGASLGLFKAGILLNESQFSTMGQTLLDKILSGQSSEGWFPEYGGADPGYQTLCMHYLAQIYELNPSDVFRKAIEISLDFLTFFAHPDGTFGGEYGSRRTEIYYPGGIASLANEFPKAASLHQFMLSSIEVGNTVTLTDVDMGNYAPLLSSSILAIVSASTKENASILPFQLDQLDREFLEAGIAVRSNKVYYLILGASNGGVLKVFDKKSKKLILDDCGVFGTMERKDKITTQSTNLNNHLKNDRDSLECESNFYLLKDTFPTPLNYVALRLMNLTLMEIRFLNEEVKKILVNMLIKNSFALSLTRKRKITLNPKSIDITDTLTNLSKLKVSSLIQGFKFTAIHMASARYYTSAQANPSEPQILDHTLLNQKGTIQVKRHLDFTDDSSDKK